MSFEIIDFYPSFFGDSSKELAAKMNELEKDYYVLGVVAPTSSYYQIVVKKKVTHV
jgi:hypothetical protein